VNGARQNDEIDPTETSSMINVGGLVGAIRSQPRFPKECESGGGMSEAVATAQLPSSGLTSAQTAELLRLD
jgi:hypothetical protein